MATPRHALATVAFLAAVAVRAGSIPRERPGRTVAPGDVSVGGPRADGLTDDPFESAQAGIDWLLPAVCSWAGDPTVQAPDCSGEPITACFGCHVQSEASLALARAGSLCFTLPDTPCVEPGDSSPVEFAARLVVRVQRKACILEPVGPGCETGAEDPGTADGRPPDLGSIGVLPECGEQLPPPSEPAPVVQSVHGGLSLAGFARFVGDGMTAPLLDLTDWLVAEQRADGRWAADRLEPPVDQGDAFATGAAITVLRTAEPHAGPGRVDALRAAVEAGQTFLDGAPLATNQDRCWALLGLVEGGRAIGDATVDRIVGDVLADQNADGGWSERPGLASNAYATGQAVHALVRAGLGWDAPAACAGLDWLLREQQADGSWRIGDAGLSTDSTRNSNFTATTWPVMALGGLRRHGVELEPPGPATSCGQEVALRVTLRNAADNPCGEFPTTDSFELSASNDSGDRVSVEPDVTAPVVAGETTTVTIRWAPGPTGATRRTSITTLVATSLGGAGSDCPAWAAAEVAVEVGPDPEPAPTGFGLRVEREGEDVVLTWSPPGGGAGGLELVEHPCLAAGACSSPPARGRLDVAPALWSGPATATGARLAAAAAPGGPGLVHYKLRAVSPCEGRRGPTCDFACADPLRCDGTCR